MIGDDEWLFCLASITQTKCNHHHPTINTHHSPSYKHFIITQHPSPNNMQSSTSNTQHPSLNTIELLAPAKNLECGMAAIEHGADAVYIGASRFGARQSAGNSVEDIGKLCEYAHRYGASVHVTINTIIYNDEFEETLALVRELVDVGVDAFLLQDMGLMSKVREIVPDTVALHASTQCDVRKL